MNARLFIAVLFAVFIIGGALFFNKDKTGTEEYVEGGFRVPAGELSFFDKDSDGDGLKDWEEELVGTDKNTPDTDGDGVNDYDQFGGDLSSYDEEEVLQKHPAETSFFNSLENNNLTKSLARALFVNSVNISQNNSSDTQTNDVVARLVGDIPLQQNTLYSQKDITVISETTNEGLRVFGNTLAQTIAQHPRKTADEIVSSFEFFVVNKASGFGEELNEQGKIYGALVKDMLTINVSKSVALQYLKLLNAYSQTSQALVNMSNVHEDAVLGIVGFGDYQNGLLEARDALTKIAELFEERDIVFSENEAGSVWGTL